MDDGTQRVPRQADAAGGGEVSRGGPALVLYDGGEVGEAHALTKDETLVGRTHGCDVVIAESRVSRRHLIVRRLEPGGGRFEVEDLDSTNGTLLNGVRITRAPLREGDRIGVGDRILAFTVVGPGDLAYQAHLTGITHLDEVTGLLTRPSLLRALDRELIRALRYRRPVSVLLMVLDEAAPMNDRSAQPSASRGLAEVGRLIRESTRATDVSGRYGEEAMMAFLPETDTESAFIVAERIRSAVSRRTFRDGEGRFQLRVSVGIATAPAHATDVVALTAAAEQALLLATQRGRNCSATFEPVQV